MNDLSHKLNQPPRNKIKGDAEPDEGQQPEKDGCKPENYAQGSQWEQQNVQQYGARGENVEIVDGQRGADRGRRETHPK